MSLNQDTIRRIKEIEIETTKLVEELLAGAYKSAFRGVGLEFEEVREYFPGDDIRTIDWNVTARTGEPHVKVYREERELTVMLLVDISFSSRYGSQGRLKRELIAEIAAAIAFSAIKNQDKVGLILFTDQIELYLPPGKGSRHVLRVIRELLAFEPKGKKTDIIEALRFFGSVRSRMSVCFLISDFEASLDFLSELKTHAKRHDLILLEVHDPLEKRFPSVPLLMVEDLETKKMQTVDTTLAENRRKVKEAFERKQRRLKKLTTGVGAGYVSFSTDRSYVDTIRKFFKLRKRMRR